MLNPMELTGRLILVTGASSGIGRETAILLSQLGANLILVGRKTEGLEKTKSMLDGTSHYIDSFDLSNVGEISQWMKGIATEKGALAGLVHCAGIQFTRPLRITTEDKFEELMHINVTAAFSLAKAFRQKGVCTSQSSIVLISSVMGLVGEAGQTAYSSSKGALITMTKSLAVELCREGIRVNCVAPAIVRTEMSDHMIQAMNPEQVQNLELMHPLGLGNPRDVAYAIAFLLADTARWITGATLTIDGGYTAR